MIMMTRSKKRCAFIISCYVAVICLLLLARGPRITAVSSAAVGISDGDDADYDYPASTPTSDDDDDDDDNSDLIQENPDYAGKKKGGDDDRDDDDGGSDDGESDNDEGETEEDGSSTYTAVDERRKKETKSMIGKLLGNSRKTPRLIRKPVKLIKQHKTKIVAAVVIYAFRRELRYFAWRLVSKPDHDPATGETRGRKLVPFDTTSILKMIIFIEVMRRIVTSSNSGEDNADSSGDRRGSVSPSLLRLLLLGTGTNPALLVLLSKFLAPSNPAFIPPVEQHYTFERINDRYKKDGMALQKAIDPSAPVGHRRQRKVVGATSSEQTNATRATMASAALHSLFPRTTSKVANASSPSSSSYNGTLILFDMNGLDSKLRDMGRIRDQVSFLLSEYGIPQIAQPATTTKSPDSDGDGGNKTDWVGKADVEVVVLLESPGGSAPDYALAAQQVMRMRNEGLKVTVVVDKVAASGGYMIACASSPGRLFAGPFAVLGSIGVVGQAVNIHNVLEGWGVKPLVFRGGKDKAPVGLIGEVTDEGIATVQSMVETTHRAFKRHVVSARPMIRDTIDELATGDTWIGYDALDVGLIDRIITSDEYVSERMKEGARVLRLVQTVQPKFPFASPTTLSGPRPANALVSVGKAIGLSVLSELQHLLDLVSRLLSGLLPETGNDGIIPMAKVRADVSINSKHGNF